MTGPPCRVAPFGDLRIEGYLLLPAAFRSLSRPSSALGAKAFTLCSQQLNLPASSKLHIASSNFVLICLMYLCTISQITPHFSCTTRLYCAVCYFYCQSVFGFYPKTLATSFFQFTLIFNIIISSIYFSMCYLVDSNLRITSSNFVLIYSMYIEYYLMNYSSFSLYYSLIINNS